MQDIFAKKLKVYEDTVLVKFPLYCPNVKGKRAFPL